MLTIHLFSSTGKTTKNVNHHHPFFQRILFFELPLQRQTNKILNSSHGVPLCRKEKAYKDGAGGL